MSDDGEEKPSKVEKEEEVDNQMEKVEKEEEVDKQVEKFENEVDNQVEKAEKVDELQEDVAKIVDDASQEITEKPKNVVENETQISDSDDETSTDYDEEKGLLGGGPSDYSDENPDSGEDDDEGEGEGEDEDGEISHMFKKSKNFDAIVKRKEEVTSACSRASDAISYKKKMCEEEKKLMEKRASRPYDPLNPGWLKSYEKHRERVSTAVTKVDTKAPVLNKHKYTSPSTFNNSLREFTRIEKENSVLLHRIANIFRGHGKVDCHLEQKIKYKNNEVHVRRHRLLNITFENLALVKKIRDVRATYDRQEQLEEFRKNEEVMQKNSYFPLFWKVKKPYIWDHLEERVLSNACLNPRPRVFMDIRVGKKGDYIGRIVMELRADVVPFTVENFRTLCTSNKFGFDCCTFYRVYPGLFWQGGEKITDQETKKERKSLYGKLFPDENFKLKHDRPGSISMANEGIPNSNGSHFIITACALPPLDNLNVVFGYVIAGMGVLKQMNHYAGQCITSGEPNRRIWVSATGELFPGADISEFQDSDDEILEDSDEDEGTPGKSPRKGGPGSTPRPKSRVKKPKGDSDTDMEEPEEPDVKEEMVDPDTSIMFFPNSEKSIMKEETGARRSRPRPSSSRKSKRK